MGFLASARRGGSEKTSFAIYLVKKNRPILMLKKIFRAFGQVLALRGHYVRTACILRTLRLGYSPKNTCHLSSSTAKQQSPHENNKTAFNLVINCRYEQATQPCGCSSKNQDGPYGIH